jgi:hypothetical protein
MKKVVLLLTLLFLFGGIAGTAIPFHVQTDPSLEDFDPLVDIEVTVEIQSIRALEGIDLFSDPDFYSIVVINNVEFKSPLWENTQYLYDLNWTATVNVPDDEEFVFITIQLWDAHTHQDRLCDISGDVNYQTNGYDVDLIYNIKTGQWSGEDCILGDPSGYGRLNGCDDGSIYDTERDCEMWFHIYQTDFDGDELPYWTEVYSYGTNPAVSNVGEDTDQDGIPIEWEHRWGYNPTMWDNHQTCDPDHDSLNNSEEYRTSEWDSNPFRKDVFVELDIMADGPNGEQCTITQRTKELLKDPYNRRNIVFHLDDGCMGGGELIPFDKKSYPTELLHIYNTYFLHNGTHNWRRGVFRYGIIIYRHFYASGMAYIGEKLFFHFWHMQGINTFAISHKVIKDFVKIQTQQRIDFVFACAIMHEIGHTFGIDFLFPPGCDNLRTIYPWQVCYWVFRNYKSVMNYRYAFSILDYSDGSHGRRDYDDWGQLDFSFFEQESSRT